MEQSDRSGLKQFKALNIAVILAVLFGFYFLRQFFTLIIFAAIAAYIFNPLFKWFRRRTKGNSSAASLTLLASLVAIILPLSLVVVITVLQIKGILNSFSAGDINLGQIGQKSLDWINNLITNIPGVDPLSLDQIRQTAERIVDGVSKGALGLLTSSVSTVAGFFTGLILYVYIFLNILTNQENIIGTIKRLNPLGSKRTEIYLKKMGLMTSAMVKGQFIIAILQGLVGAAILYVAGLKDVFFFLFMILTLLSIIPLGAGIVIVPIGVALILLGDVWQGVLVLATHFAVIVNIDNVLRPRLVPKSAQLNSALTLLGVFAGIAMFGFLGIIIGPVIMILIVTTIQMYLEAKAEPEPKKA